MKEQCMQLGFTTENMASKAPIKAVEIPVFEASGGLTSQPQRPHTDGREFILMEPRGEVGPRPSTAEVRLPGQPKFLTPEQTEIARGVSAKELREGPLGIDVQRFQSPQDPSFVDRVKYWWHEFHHKQELRKQLKQKRTQEEYVSEILKFNNDVVGNSPIKEIDLARSAAMKVVLQQAQQDGYSNHEVVSEVFKQQEILNRRKAKSESHEAVELKQDIPTRNPIPIDDHFPPGQVQELVRRYNDMLSKNLLFKPDQLLDLYQQMQDAQLGQIYADDPVEASRQVDLINAALQDFESQLVRTFQEGSGGYGRGDYMTIGEIYVEGADGHQRKATEKDVILNRAVRDEVFNNLFANADTQTNEFFDRAWNIMTDGANYEAFMTDLRLARQGKIKPEVLHEWIESYGSRQEGGDVRPGESEVDYTERMRKRLQEELAGDLTRYAKERNVRKSLHDANAIINIPRLEAENIFNYIEQFGSDLQDYAIRMPGVRQMMDIFETQTRMVMAENGGYLPPEAIQEGSKTEMTRDSNGNPLPASQIKRPEIEVRSKQAFEAQLKKKAIVLRDEKTGEALSISDLKPWQVDRIYATARGMSLLSMRLMSIAAESSLPPNGEYTSLFMQDALQIYSPYHHLMAKYYVPTDKALTPLLYQDEKPGLMPGVRGPFSRTHMEKMYEIMHHSEAREMLEGRFGAKLELRKQNPMRCGDAFTYLSWRAGTEVKDITASKEFLQKGAARMARRLLGVERSAEELLKKDGGIHYSSLEAGSHGSATQDEIMAINAYVAAHGGHGVTEANREEILHLKEKMGEYGNWIGTGFRFEKMRQDLEKFRNEQSGDEASFKAVEPKAQALLQRMIELQPHRMYLKSRIIQERLQKGGALHGIDMRQVTENLSFLETKMYQMREQLLEGGYTFDGVDGNRFTLDTIYDMIQPDEHGNKLPNDAAWGMTQRFISVMREDFDNNKEKHGTYYKDPHHAGIERYNIEETGHFDEFIKERDYHHGYILWSGDAPLEEFHFTAVGGTGGFIRRAGENKDVMGGTKGLGELLSHLHDQYTTPEAVYGKLYEIYSANKSYDIAQAKKTIADITQGIVQFFGETSLARVPGIGEIAERMGYGSFAQVVYGKNVGAVWTTSDVDNLVDKMMRPHMGMYPNVAKRITESVNATTLDHGINIAQTVALLAVIAAGLYIAKQGVDEATK